VWALAGSSAAAAAWLTTPFDLVKLRMQLDPATSAYHMKGSFVENFQTLYAANGPKGMFRGATTRVMFFAPAYSISMLLFEVFKTAIG
jgi:solute carrier family 25 aspartate/glutamate transporter 12/13